MMNGYVKIKPFKDKEMIGRIYLPKGLTTHDYLNITGEVVEVSEKMPYFGREAEAIRQQYPDGYTRPESAQKELTDFNSRSLNYDIPKEIKKGDVVVFDWKLKAFSDEWKGQEYIYMRYDSLIMVIEKDGYRMLNGYMLVVPERLKVETTLIVTKEEYSDMLATVYHEGTIVNHYREVPYAKDLKVSLKGKNVFVRKKRMRKLEKFYMGMLDRNDYHLIQRKDLLGYEP
jgi:hypothetical protein